MRGELDSGKAVCSPPREVGPACGSGAMDEKTLVVQEAQIPMYTGDESSWVSIELRSSPGEA